jgi:hypothetical protein
MMLPPILLTLIYLILRRPWPNLDAEACGPQPGARVPPRRFPVPVEMVRAEIPLLAEAIDCVMGYTTDCEGGYDLPRMGHVQAQGSQRPRRGPMQTRPLRMARTARARLVTLPVMRRMVDAVRSYPPRPTGQHTGWSPARDRAAQARFRNLLIQRSGGQCEYPGCTGHHRATSPP